MYFVICVWIDIANCGGYYSMLVCSWCGCGWSLVRQNAGRTDILILMNHTQRLDSIPLVALVSYSTLCAKYSSHHVISQVRIRYTSRTEHPPRRANKHARKCTYNQYINSSPILPKKPNGPVVHLPHPVAPTVIPGRRITFSKEAYSVLPKVQLVRPFPVLDLQSL